MTDKNDSLKTILDGVLSSYAEQKGAGAAFPAWLASTLQEKLPGLSAEEASNLAGEIIQGVASYNETLNDVNKASEAGCSKEDWLTGRLAESYADLPPDEAGARLLQIKNDLNAVNAQLIHEIDTLQPVALDPAAPDPAGWNMSSLKTIARKVAEGVGLAGLGVVANAVKYRMENKEPVAMRNAIKKVLQDGTPSDSSEVKAAVAGAVKVAAMNGLVDRLPEDTPMDVICDMAGVAVEGAEALVDVARGKGSMMEAMDKVGRAAVAAGCCYYAVVLKGAIIAAYPFGPLAVKLLGGLFDHMESPQFFNDVYTTVRNTAIATWEGLKAVVRDSPLPKVLSSLLS